MSGYNGSDEYEIMDKVLKEYSDYQIDSTFNKTKQLMLSKKGAKRAAEVLLEACHKLPFKDVPNWIAKNFESTWKYYD